MRVLVCEDDAGTRLVLNRLLVQHLDCTVVECGDGAEALGVLRRGDEVFDLAVLDINVPSLNGVELVEAIRQSPALHDLPIVMFTGDAREDVVLRLLQLNVRDYLVKPLRTAAAVVKLKRLKHSLAR